MASRANPLSFVKNLREEILSDWRSAAQQLPDAARLSPVELVDRIPEMLDLLVERADGRRPIDPRLGIEAAADVHAMARLEESVDISTVVEELALLRQAVHRVWSRASPASSHEELWALDREIDHAIAASTSRYASRLLRRLSESEQRATQLADEDERTIAKLDALLAASPVGIAFVDRDMRYLRINDALAALNGLPAADHIGKTLHEVFPDEAPQIEPLMRLVLERGEPLLNLEYTTPGASPRERRSVLANLFPVFWPGTEVFGAGAIVIDVSEEKHAREALENERRRLQSIIDHSPAAIWVVDANEHIVLANQRLATALGHPFRKVIGKRTQDLLPSDMGREHAAHDQIVLREQRSLEVEEVVPGPSGTRTYLAVKFPIPGDPPSIGGIATDITERKRMEHDLREAVRTREDLLAIVSHDLRGPLGSVKLAATLLTNQLAPTDPRARRQLEIIQRSCMRMEDLIEDLLDTANIRVGKLTIETKPEIASDLIAEALELQEPSAVAKGVSLVRGDSLDGVAILCDRHRILQVFSNLIGNSLKFCRAGDSITIASEREDGFVRFVVADTGPGIAPEILPTLFDQYACVAVRGKKSSGLGLYIVRGIVERHGGKIWVESTARGARFVFTIPIADEPADLLRATPQ